ncbi:Pycsar system effector family protein [Roseiconus lacunae]|uniref:Pycsar system effector family protein n=1 Tax=Roseiconus lacunae TaxID=2605694 RepID=UPI001E563BAC|nr:Pycsar system effector family protein [Roseiconus lacunae]MCD0462093.1 DUF5706 domain-containing protein [Roseiconus lacunae]
MIDETQSDPAIRSDASETASFLWNVHSYLTTFIQFADVKAGVVFVWSSSVLGWLATGGYAKFVVNGQYWESHTKLATSIVLAVVALMAAFMASVLVVYPSLGYLKKRTESKCSGGAPDQLVFWRSIVDHERPEYIERVGAQSKLDLATANNVYDLAGVANKKYFFLQWAIGLAAAGSLFAILALVFNSPAT